MWHFRRNFAVFDRVSEFRNRALFFLFVLRVANPGQYSVFVLFDYMHDIYYILTLFIT